MAKGMCGKCGVRPSQPNHNNCKECHNKNMREWRKTHPMTLKQRMKNNCSSYANTYLNRGKIKKPEKCECCGIASAQEMHHENYNKPLEITWLCKKCHREIHKQQKGQFIGPIIKIDQSISARRKGFYNPIGMKSGWLDRA